MVVTAPYGKESKEHLINVSIKIIAQIIPISLLNI